MEERYSISPAERFHALSAKRRGLYCKSLVDFSSIEREGLDQVQGWALLSITASGQLLLRFWTQHLQGLMRLESWHRGGPKDIIVFWPETQSTQTIVHTSRTSGALRTADSKSTMLLLFCLILYSRIDLGSACFKSRGQEAAVQPAFRIKVSQLWLLLAACSSACNNAYNRCIPISEFSISGCLLDMAAHNIHFVFDLASLSSSQGWTYCKECANSSNQKKSLLE